MILKCLIAGCNNLSAPVLKRGLCMSCYSQAKKMVDSGRTSWDHLVAHGLALSVTDASASPFTKALEAAESDDKKEGS